MLEPTTFHRASSVSPLSAEKIFTNNSGALVQNATIVKPITRGEIPKRTASEEAHDTRTSAHFMSITNPMSKKI